MNQAREVIHVAWGVSRSNSVRDALRLQGCGERVIGLSHDLSVGPIDRLDAAARRDWLEANLRADDGLREAHIASDEPWIEATTPGVHPVYWVCRTDPSEHASFLEFVSRMDGRPLDIVDATGVDVSGGSGASPVRSLGQLRPEEILAAGLSKRRRSLTRAEADALKNEWAQLRAENAPLRIVRDGHLMSAPLTYFDDLLTERVSPDGEILIKLVARVLHNFDTEPTQPGQRCSNEFLFARILALGEQRALEVSGPGPGMRDYEVRRSGAHAGAPSTT